MILMRLFRVVGRAGEDFQTSCLGDEGEKVKVRRLKGDYMLRRHTGDFIHMISTTTL